MALEIEDGSAKSNANSYATLAELVTFAAARNTTLPATDAEREALLVGAVDYLEAQNYKGSRKTREQALQWPRYGATVHGFDIASDEIPRELKNAQLQLALEAISTQLMPNSVPSDKGAVIEETVQGAVTVKYAEPATGPGTMPVFTKVDAFLDPLLATAGFQAMVRRG